MVLVESCYEASNVGLQLRRAISIQAEGRNHLRSMLSRRQLQGFVGLRADTQFIITIAAATCRRVKGADEMGTLRASFFRSVPSKIEIQMTAASGNFPAGWAPARQARTQIVAEPW